MPIPYTLPQPTAPKKEKMNPNHLNPNSFTSVHSFQASTSSNNTATSNIIMEPSSSSSSKTWEETENDQLMEVLGYKVKSSDMPQVAQKLQQLELAMFSSHQDSLSDVLPDSIHYNPSDLSTFLESMIYEFNPSENNNNDINNTPNQNSSSVVVFDDSAFESDLTAIPGKAIYPPSSPPPTKRLKPSWESENEVSFSYDNTKMNSPTLSRPVVMVESEENGVRLVHALMACAEAVQTENYKLAEALVKQIGVLAVSQGGSMRKVATYFADALARRIYKLYPCNQNDSCFSDYLQMHFYEACPYLKFAHFTANQGILEAFAGKSCVHIIDFGIKQGMQWPALLQALALRPGGPPSFRLTGIGPPSSDNSDYLQDVGWKLAQLADSIDVKFEYRGYVASSLADLDASMFDVREGETVAVNSIFELHPMLARPGAIEKVLSVVRGLKPCIFTVVEQEANHNGPHFLDRFTEALHYYSTLFDSVEGGGSGGGAGGDGEVGVVGGVTEQDKVMTEVYLGRQICNVLACEGIDRVERHETLAQWRTRFDSAEFEPVHLGSNAFKQASMLLALNNGDGYRVEENNGCLLLGWHTRPLISTSAWKLK